MKRQHTVLFFPVEVGLAHVIRSLAIAEKLHELGYHVLFALPKRKHSLISSSRVTLLDVSGYTNQDGIDFVSRLKDHSFIKPFIEEELQLLKEYKPDAVVNDFRISAIASAFLLDIPSFFITGSGGLPYGCYLPNPGIPKILHMALSPIIQKAIGRLKSTYVHSLSQIMSEFGENASIDELFEYMKYIVPESPLYLPHVNKKLVIHYSGPIFWDGFEKHYPHWLKDLQPNGKTMYLTFGGTGFDSSKMLHLSRMLLDKGYTVVVSTSTIVDVHSFPSHPRLKVEKYLPGKEVSKRVDMVVCHGGYGTMIEAVLSGKPIVAIPFNPDQLLHSLRFQELGLAKSVIGVGPELFINLLKLNWKNFENVGKGISVEKIIDAIEYVLQNKLEYVKMIKTFTSKMYSSNGAKSAADFIDRSL